MMKEHVDIVNLVKKQEKYGGKLHMEWKKIITITGIVLGVYAAYKYVLPAAFPFLAAWVFAVLLHPAVVKIEKKTNLKKSVISLFLLGSVFLILGLLIFVGVKELFQQVKEVLLQYPLVAEWLNGVLNDGCYLLEEITGVEAKISRAYLLKRISEMQSRMISAMIPGVFGSFFAWARGSLLLISSLVITFISSVLLIHDMEKIKMKSAEYSCFTRIRRVLMRLGNTTVTYLKAQVWIVILVSAVCSVGFWLLGSPCFLLLGILLGILDAFPIIGTGTVLYPAAIILFISGSPVAAVGCIVLDLLTSFMREALEPRLLGGKLGIPAIIILIAVYIGVFLYGGWGVFLGPLSFSTMYEIGKEWKLWQLEQK